MEEYALLAVDAAHVVAALLVLLVAKQIKNWLSPSHDLDHELTSRDNPALGLALCGYLVGVIAIYLGAVLGTERHELPGLEDFALELGLDLAWVLGGILALNLGSLVLDRLILPRFSTAKELVEDRNAGLGAVEGGASIATGLVVAGAIYGDGGVLSALVFFALGQAALVLFGLLYERLTSYNLHEEIECDNVAAGVVFGASMVAMGIVLLKATQHHFESWTESLTQFGLYTALGFALLAGLRKIADALFLPGASLDYEIATDRNLNAAWIEGTLAVGIAALVYALL